MPSENRNPRVRREVRADGSPVPHPSFRNNLEGGIQEMELTPIGYLSCPQKYRFEMPRQGAFAHNVGRIVLNDDPRLADACHDLEGVERIWVLFLFHLNSGWRPFVRPPVSPGGRRIGTFATRAPFRPNPIGLSCVELERVERNILHIRNFDLLDGTPVLDLKPYVPASDSFPDSRVGWLEQAEEKAFRIVYSDAARNRIGWIRENGGPDLENFCSVQLTLDPFNRKRKRLERDSEGNWRIGCRTWQVVFHAEEKRIFVTSVLSHYSSGELAEVEDRYGDKKLHREFRRVFPNE